jgi:16S rRNA (uracil1498-N3)-methyltransferase
MEHFYVNPRDVMGDSLTLRDGEFRHLIQVLRRGIGDVVRATDGRGNLFEFEISKVSKDFVRGRILKKLQRNGEPNFLLTLAQAIPKGSRFDWVVEKGTEIGVAKFIPLITERGIAGEGSAKISRWQKIALAAMKQSCRSVLPEVTEAMGLREVLECSNEYSLKLIAHHEERGKGLNDAVDLELSNKGIILIGPEGGFSDEEVSLAIEWGFYPFSLGPRRLRTETAGIVAGTLLLGMMGELG